MKSEGISHYRWLNVPPIEELRGRMLGRILIKMGVLSRNQVHECLKIQNQRQGGVKIGDIFQELGLVSGEQLLIALAAQRGMEYVCLDEVDIQPCVIEKVPAAMAMTYRMIPVRFDECLNQLVVALDTPENLRATDDLSTLMGFKVAAMITESSALDEALVKHYGEENKTVTELSTGAREEIIRTDHTTGTLGDRLAKESCKPSGEEKENQPKNVRAHNPNITQAKLSPLSRIHLLLFRAEGAARHRDFREASRLVNESIREIATMISNSLTDAIDELNSRVNYIRDSLDEDNVNAYLDEIAALRKNKWLKLKAK